MDYGITWYQNLKQVNNLWSNKKCTLLVVTGTQNIQDYKIYGTGSIFLRIFWLDWRSEDGARKSIKQLNRVISVSLGFGLGLVLGLGVVLGLVLGLMPSSDIDLKSTVLSSSFDPSSQQWQHGVWGTGQFVTTRCFSRRSTRHAIFGCDELTVWRVDWQLSITQSAFFTISLALHELFFVFNQILWIGLRFGLRWQFNFSVSVRSFAQFDMNCANGISSSWRRRKQASRASVSEE